MSNNEQPFRQTSPPQSVSRPATTPRQPVRRLSQLEPVHIAALNQEYRSQIREANNSPLDSDVQKEHFDKARKIKMLLAKYDQMVKDQKLSRESSPQSTQSTQPTQNTHTLPPAPQPAQRHDPISPEAQLAHFKNLEREANESLIKVERTIREAQNLDPEVRQNLKQQEQNLRTKRDQYKSTVLTITQQLQVKKVQKSSSPSQSASLAKPAPISLPTQHVQAQSQLHSEPMPAIPQSISDPSSTSFNNYVPASSLKYTKKATPPISSSKPTTTLAQTVTSGPISQAKNVRGPGKVGRPPLTSKRTFPPPPSNISIPEKVFNKRKISELVKSMMPAGGENVVDPEVEDLLGDLIEEFVDDVTKFSVRLAKHRKAERVESKDVHVHLERNWDIRVPGIGGKDEVEIVRRMVPAKSYVNRLDAVNDAKHNNGTR